MLKHIYDVCTVGSRQVGCGVFNLGVQNHWMNELRGYLCIFFTEIGGLTKIGYKLKNLYLAHSFKDNI